MLDRESRLTLHRALRHLAVCAIAAGFAWAYSGAGALGQFTLSLQFACSMAALWAMAFALGRREPLNGPTLNHWDEGMGLNCLSLGLHIAQRMLT